MSKKPRPILGPDGKPLPPRKQEPPPAKTYDGVAVIPRYLTNTLHPFWSLDGQALTVRLADPRPKTSSLADRVKADVDALTSDFEGEGGAELPRPERDLSAYQDALDAARANCPHDAIESTMYARGEWFCHDCQRYMSTAVYRAEREKRTGGGMFGRWFT